MLAFSGYFQQNKEIEFCSSFTFFFLLYSILNPSYLPPIFAYMLSLGCNKQREKHQAIASKKVTTLPGGGGVGVGRAKGKR